MPFQPPIGTEEERNSGNVWPGTWTDANRWTGSNPPKYKLGKNNWAYHTGADLNNDKPRWDSDAHAQIFSMGDGEVCGTGVEINGEVTVRVTVRNGEAPERVWVETPTDWATTGQGPSLDDAVAQAVAGMTNLLMRRFDLDKTEAFLLVSARGDVRVGQCARIPGCDATAYVLSQNRTSAFNASGSQPSQVTRYYTWTVTMHSSSALFED